MFRVSRAVVARAEERTQADAGGGRPGRQRAGHAQSNEAAEPAEGDKAALAGNARGMRKASSFGDGVVACNACRIVQPAVRQGGRAPRVGMVSRGKRMPKLAALQGGIGNYGRGARHARDVAGV